MEENFKKIRKLIASKTGLEIEEVERESYFEDDLNIGEMELLEILEELEEMFAVELVDQRDDIETMQDLLDIISEQIE